MRKQLFDNHGRVLNYVRLAVTDRCNLRCFYCMPEEGIQYINKTELMSYEEIHRAMKLLAKMGIEKVRITGGEPFIRKDLMKLLWSIRRSKGIRDLIVFMIIESSSPNSAWSTGPCVVERRPIYATMYIQRDSFNGTGFLRSFQHDVRTAVKLDSVLDALFHECAGSSRDVLPNEWLEHFVFPEREYQRENPVR